MRKLFLVFCASLLSLRAGADTASTLAQRVIDVLRHDDLARFAKLVDPNESDPRACEELRKVIDRYDCLQIDRYDWSVTSATGDRIALTMNLEMTGRLKAAWRPERRLPRTWHIEARRSGGAWLVSRAMTEERRIGIEMTHAPTIADAECLLDAAGGVDRLLVISSYARELGEARVSGDARLQHALALARETRDVATENVVSNEYGVWFRGRDPARILQLAKEAAEVSRARGTRDDLADSYLHLGLAYVYNGDLERARATYGEIVEMVDLLDDPTTSIKCLQMQMWLDAGTGSPTDQLHIAEKMLELARRIGWEEGEQVALFNHMEVHLQLGNYDVARADCVRILRAGREQGNRKFAAYALGNLAAIDMREEHYADATRHYREAAALFTDKDLIVNMLEDLGRAGIRRGEFVQAAADLAKAEAALPPQDGRRVTLIARRSELQLASGRPEEAVATAREALRLFDALTEGREYSIKALVLRDLARALAASHREEEAIAALRGAIAAIETREEEVNANPLGRMTFLQEYVGMYVELVEVLAARNRIDEAFRVAEEMKGRGLREAIAESHIDASASLSDEERAKEEALQTRIAELNKTLLAARSPEVEAQRTDARRELEAFRAELRLEHPIVTRRRIDTVTAAELPAGSDSLALIEYVVARTQVLAFVVTADKPIRLVRMPIASAKLQRDVRELESLIAARSPAYRGAARRLYAALVAPLEKHLRGATTLAIAPDGVLWTVPFQALVARDGQHLVDRYALFYAHSLSLLRNASALHSSAPSNLLALGNPAVGGSARSTMRALFRDAALGQLVDAESEVQALASMYPSRGRSVYYRDRATEGAFKSEAPNFRVIHIAAHAIVDDRAPMYSAIALAPGTGSDDGLLEAREVIDLPLNADLAVLSACQTARGKVGSGEGVIGLSWAFFAAGCPTTVVSQWSAESAATAKLMIEFHRRLRAGESTAKALRGAQKSVRGIAKYRHPFYWAPFVAIGAGQR